MPWSWATRADAAHADAADPDFIRTWSEYNQYAETLKAILNGNLGGYQIKVNIPSTCSATMSLRCGTTAFWCVRWIPPR